MSVPTCRSFRSGLSLQIEGYDLRQAVRIRKLQQYQVRWDDLAVAHLNKDPDDVTQADLRSLYVRGRVGATYTKCVVL